MPPTRRRSSRPLITGGGSGRRLPEGSEVRDQRRRALYRADAPVGISCPGRPRARCLDHRRRAGPRGGAHRGPGRQGQARRPGGAPPRDLLHAARRAVITSTRSGAATASLPAALTEASRDAILAGLARRRVVIDRDRHGTATGKPRPGRASRPAGRVWPPPPRPPRSASAAPTPPDPAATSRPAQSPQNPPAVEPAAARNGIRAVSMPARRDHSLPATHPPV